MLCRNPYMAGSIPFGCGQCLPCRVNRRRQWMWRQVLESYCHDYNCFVTLTYDALHIPGNWSLEPRALSLWLKSFREAIRPHRVRYYAVGEYGERNCRPHYHVSLFGVSPFNSYNGKSIPDWINQTWGRGYTSCYEFNHLTAQYTAGYVVKKLKDRKDGQIWNVPEFARMSLRPGIGARAMEDIASQLRRTANNWQTGDVPHQLRIGSRTIPLGRYLIKRLRAEVGFTDEYSKEVRDRWSWEKSVELQALYQDAPALSFKQKYLTEIEGRLRSVEARAALFKKKDTL